MTRVPTSNTITWLEQFDFHPPEVDLSEVASSVLEITIHEKGSGRDDTVARYYNSQSKLNNKRKTLRLLFKRSILDLTHLEREQTHSMNCSFAHGGSGELSLLVTISGTISASETISEISTNISPTQLKELEVVKNRYVRKLF